MLDGLGAARFHRADALFETLGEAANFEAHAVEACSFAAFDVVEALLERVRHAHQFFADCCAGGVIVARFNSAQALIDSFRHAADFERDCFDGLRLTAFSSGEAAVHVGECAFETFAGRAFECCVQLRLQLFTGFANHGRDRLRHGVETGLEHGAHSFGFLHGLRLLDASAERGDGFFERADGGVGGGLGLSQARR